MVILIVILCVFIVLISVINLCENAKSEIGKTMPVDFEFFPNRERTDPLKIFEFLLSHDDKDSTHHLTNLPFGRVCESGGGMQCYCPNCEYGIGTQDTFIEGFSRQVKRVCKTCGTEYISLEIENVPQSGRWNWTDPKETA